MSKIKTILEKLVQDPELKKYPHSYNPIILDKAEQSINNTRLTEEEIFNLLFKTELPLIEGRENKFLVASECEVLAYAIYEAQTKKLE